MAPIPTSSKSHANDRQTDRRTRCKTLSTRCKCTLDARRHSRSLLVLRAMQDSGVQYVVLAIFREYGKYGKYLVREIITVSLLNLRLQSDKNVDRVRFAAEVQ